MVIIEMKYATSCIPEHLDTNVTLDQSKMEDVRKMRKIVTAHDQKTTTITKGAIEHYIEKTTKENTENILSPEAQEIITNNDEIKNFIATTISEAKQHVEREIMFQVQLGMSIE